MTALLVEFDPAVASSTPVAVTTNRNPRFLFVDGLRAIAACCVMLFHFVASGSFYPIFQSRLPATFRAAGFGYLGVDIFFVISGFVVAFSVRNDRVNGRFIRDFVLRRSLRLDPPYLVTIGLTLLLLWFYNAGLGQHYTPMPTLKQTLANTFYLTGILKIQPMLPIFWTLCLEVQFYLLFVFALWTGKLVGGSRSPQLNWVSGGLLGGFGLWSVAIVGGYCRSMDGWFVNDWNLFLAGAVLWWTIDRKIEVWWLLGLTGAMLFASAHTQAWCTWTGLATVLAIGTVASVGRLETALDNGPLQFLARISYSLYLLHALIGPQIDGWVAWHFRDSLAAAIVSVMFSIAVSIAAAWVMHRYVEIPSIRLGKRFKHRAVSRGAD